MSDDASPPTWHDPVRLCLCGLRDTSERLREVEGTANELATAAAITEAVMWCCSLDELWWEVEGYETMRDSDDDGRLIPGLRWTRNRGIHEVLALHTTTEGLSFPMRFPMRFSTVRWRSEVEDGRRPDPRRRRIYEAHLRGQPVWLTLASAERFLTSMAEQVALGGGSSAP